jgi:hypothetical protein
MFAPTPPATVSGAGVAGQYGMLTAPAAVSPVPHIQISPRPDTCNPQTLQSGHSGAMVIGLGDGSVRNITQTITALAFYSAVTPGGGEATPLD